MIFEKLRRRREFVRVQQCGQRFKGRLLVVLVAAADTSGTRVGLTVSRRVGNAVIRNRVRRRLREIVRIHPEGLVPQCDHVVIALTPAADASFQALEDELIWLLERARRDEVKPTSGRSSS